MERTCVNCIKSSPQHKPMCLGGEPDQPECDMFVPKPKRISIMLQQLHHQYKDGKTDFVSQSDAKTLEEVDNWLRDVRERHPLPEGAQWLICNERSEYFVMTPEIAGAA